MNRRRGLAWCCLAAIAATWWLPTNADDTAERLAKIKREIEAREKKAAEYRLEADGVLGELDALDRELAEIRRSVRRLRRRENSAEEELVAARAGVVDAEAVMAKTQKELEARLVALYKFSSAGGVNTLYSAADFASFARKRAGLTRVLESDRRLFAAHSEAQAAWRAKRDARQQAKDEVVGSRAEIRAREARLRRKSVERRNTVALLQSRSNRETRAAAELGEAAKRLEKALRRMSRAPSASPGRGLAKGRVLRPTGGKIRFGFGRVVDPEFGTETRRTGIEIAAPRGSGVRAVASGRVLYAGWFRGYGQMVIIDHGSSHVTVSGYLDSIAVEAGDAVNGGHVIGAVGDTGSLSGPGLYFEIRRSGTPVDPKDWLVRR